MNGINALVRGDKRASSLRSILHSDDKMRRLTTTKQEKDPHQNAVCQHLDLGLPCIQDCEK